MARTVSPLIGAGLGHQDLFAGGAGDGLTLTQQNLTGGAFGRQLLRAGLAGRRGTQAVFRRHAERRGGDGHELVRHDLGQADALLEAAAGRDGEGG